jgi:hypothetical protein
VGLVGLTFQAFSRATLLQKASHHRECGRTHSPGNLTEHGIQYAMELSGHTSSRYIWRYVKPAREKLEEAVEELF